MTETRHKNLWRTPVKKPTPPPETPPPEAPAEKILSREDASRVQRALVANIIKKIQRGGTATSREMAILKEAETAGQQPEWVKNFAELAEVFACDRHSFSRWKKENEDAPRGHADGWHNVQEWRDWLAKHPEVMAGAEATNMELQRLNLEEMRQRVRKAIHLNDVREGQYTRNEVFADRITEVVAQSKQLLRQKFENELPPYLARQEASQCRVLCKRALDEVCLRLSELTKDWPI
jgi:hypothetical protein